MLISLMFLSLSIFLISSSNRFLILLSLAIIGFSFSLISIPCLPELLNCIEQDPQLANKYDQKELENVLSGLFITS